MDGWIVRVRVRVRVRVISLSYKSYNNKNIMSHYDDIDMSSNFSIRKIATQVLY